MPAPVYLENFDELTPGVVLPTGWSAPIPGDWVVAAPAAPFVPMSPPNVLVRSTGAPSPIEAVLAPCGIDSPLVTVAVYYDGSGAGVAGAVLHGSNAGSVFTGYAAYYNPSSSVFAIVKYVSGGATSLASTPFTVSPSSWYWVQFGFDATTNTLVARFWQDGMATPPSPQLKVNDSSIAHGATGICNELFPGYYDSFAVGDYSGSGGGGTGLGVPTVSSGGLSPTSGIVGTFVTITGTNFGTDPTGVKVTFNGALATIVSIADTRLVVSVPDGATTGIVLVSNAQGPGTSSEVFTVLPNITSFTPMSGPVGTSVAISGTNFNPVPDNNLVSFNGTQAAVTLASYHLLTATVPAGATTGKIRVMTADGVALSAGVFTVGTNVAPTITSFTPSSGPVLTSVTITGTGFIAGAGNNTVVFSNGASGTVTSATSTQIVAIVPATAVTGTFTVSNLNGSATSATAFTVTTGTGVGLPPDPFSPDPPDDGTLTPEVLISYLRAMLKDTADDMEELGIQNPVWSDASLYRFLELARGEYSRLRGRHSTTLMSTIAQQQFYANPAGCLGGRVEDVLWAPAGFDLDQISAMAAALAGGPGLLWGGGVPVVGRVYFDSPASITVWSIIREAWRNTFGGHWQPVALTYCRLLMKTPCLFS